MIQVRVGDRERRTGPVRPEMTQVAAHRVGLSVDQFVRQGQLMKRLVPELFLGMLLEHAASDTGQRRRQDEVLDEVRMIFGERLGDAAADVVATNDRSAQTEFVDEGHDAASLGRSAVSLEWVDTMLVGVSKAPQIGHDGVAVCSKQWHDVAKVRMV